MNKNLIFLTIFGFLLIFSSPVFAEIPLSYNGTNATWVWRNGAINVSAQWTNTTNYTWIEFTNVSGTFNTTKFACPKEDQQVAAGITLTCDIAAAANYTNYTITPVLSQWNLSSNSFKIYVNDSDGNENVTSTLSFDLWTLGNLTCLFSNYPYLVSTAGVSSNATCLVRDTLATGTPGINGTNAPVAVLVYNNTDNMSSALINQSGWATITFSTPTEDSYTLVANMSNNTTIYVNVTSPFSVNNSMFVVNSVNPRPIYQSTSDVTLSHVTWEQYEPNYSFPLPFIVPNFTSGGFQGMIMPTNIYAPLMYMSDMFFKHPTIMETFAYNLTFNATNATPSINAGRLINITIPLPMGENFTTKPLYKNQTILPAKFETFQPPEFFNDMNESFVPPNMTILMKNPNNFTVNVTNSSGYTYIVSGSQRYNLTNMPAPNATFTQGKIVLNLSNISSEGPYKIFVILGIQDITCFDQVEAAPGGFENQTNFMLYCEQHSDPNDPYSPPIGPPKFESAPALITGQSVTGFNPFEGKPEDAQLLNVTETMTYNVNITNPLLNYTGDKLYAEFRFPLNFTEWNTTWNSEVIGSVNASENHTVGWWNDTGSVWMSISSSTTPYVNESVGCTNMTDDMPGSPMYGKNMTMCYKAILFNLNQTVAGSGLASGWVYDANVSLNISVSMGFKIFDKTNSTTGTQMGAAGSTNQFNATIMGGQSTGGGTGGTSTAESNAGLFKIDDTILPNITRACASGSSPSTCPNITVRVNNQPYYNWTTGSPLIITSQQSGAQSISVSYSVPSAPAAAAAVTGAAAADGIAVTAKPYIKLAEGKVNITLSSLVVGGKMIANIARYKDIAIRQLNITVVNNVANIKIMITKLPGLPATVSHEIIGKVYHYINIERINITDSDINKTFIKFAVNKTWLTDNNVDSSNITLYRWSDNRWNELTTTKVDEDEREVFYSAESPGLSVFVIGTKGGAPVIEEVCTENWSCTAWSECIDGTQTRTCTDLNACGTTVNKPAESQSCEVVEAEVVGFPIWSTVVIIIVIIVVVILLYTQRKKLFKKSR